MKGSHAVSVFRLYAKLSTVVRQNGMNLVRNRRNKPRQKIRGNCQNARLLTVQ